MASRGQGISAAQERKHGLLHDGVMGWVFRYRVGGSQGKSHTDAIGDFVGKVPLLRGSGSWLWKPRRTRRARGRARSSLRSGRGRPSAAFDIAALRGHVDDQNPLVCRFKS